MSSSTGSPVAHSVSVTQASGMVSVQASCTCAEAIVLMKARAVESHHTMDEIAHALLERSIRFGV